MKRLLYLIVLVGSFLFSTSVFAEKRIALTFDDGPRGKITKALLKVLKENNVRATFFVLGENCTYYPALLKQMHEEGHQVANHSYNHPVFSKMKLEDVEGQLKKTNALIEAQTGVKVKFFRSPYGALTKTQKKKILEDLGMQSVMWNICLEDWKKNNSSEAIAQFIINNAKDGGIVLLHDYMRTVDIVKVVIPALKAKGYTFVTIEELRGSTPEATHVENNQNTETHIQEGPKVETKKVMSVDELKKEILRII